jgi:peroxiredoxin
MKASRITILTACAAVLVPTGLSCRKQAAPQKTPTKQAADANSASAKAAEIVRLPNGATAPNFTLATLDGRSISLADYAGKPVLLDFWAAWCPPCKASLPLVDKLHEEFAGKDIGILCVCTSTKRPELEAFMKEHPDYKLTVLFDPAEKPDSIGSGKYLIDGFPSFFVIGRDGKIVRSFKGLNDEHKDGTLKTLLEQQLATAAK